jgi:hypothetical protein
MNRNGRASAGIRILYFMSVLGLLGNANGIPRETMGSDFPSVKEALHPARPPDGPDIADRGSAAYAKARTRPDTRLLELAQDGFGILPGKARGRNIRCFRFPQSGSLHYRDRGSEKDRISVRKAKIAQKWGHSG